MFLLTPIHIIRAMKKFIGFVVLGLLTAFVLVGCEQKESAPPSGSTNAAGTNAPGK